MWNIGAKIYQYLKFEVCNDLLCMWERAFVKGRNWTNKKIINKKTSVFYCLHCLADYLEVSEEELLDKIEEFKEEGCTLFD